MFEFQSKFSAILGQFRVSFGSVSGQFRVSFGAVSGQFWVSSGALSGQLQEVWEAERISRVDSVQYRSDLLSMNENADYKLSSINIVFFPLA